jgi:FkbM family methyltransferase
MGFLSRKIRRLYGIIWRVKRKLDKTLIHCLLPFFTKGRDTSAKNLVLERLGTDYGGWTTPIELLTENSVCYCFGIGIDASFDFELANSFGCNVFSFDSTPKSIAYMEREKYDRNHVHFIPIGIWDEETKLRFYSPANPEETSHSVYDLHGTGNYFEAECKKLSTIMKDLGHNHIDLLKLDIEGSWGRVLNNIANEKINISILCVELDSPVTLKKVLKVINTLKGLGLRLVHWKKDNYLFIQDRLLAQKLS